VRVRAKSSKSTRSSLIELGLIVGVAVLLALGIQAWIVKPYRIPSGSMEPTLSIGQRVLVDRIGMHFGDPHVGEIVVFNPPANATNEVCGVPRPSGAVCSEAESKRSSTYFIKRIVAGPGDVISIVEGHVIRNGKREPDGYTKPCSGVSECNFRAAVKIPPGHWFMMGDNRGESDDSRFWGPVPTGWIVGGAFATYWPPDRIGFF
jgi:signal peptidase I